MWKIKKVAIPNIFQGKNPKNIKSAGKFRIAENRKKKKKKKSGLKNKTTDRN